MVQTAVEALVIRCTQHRRERLAELPRVWLHFVRSESLVVIPSRKYREMVCTRRFLLEHVIADVSILLPALFGQTREQNPSLVFPRRRDIHVCHDEYLASAARTKFRTT